MVEYNGMEIVTHSVCMGETLTSIAKVYGFSRKDNYFPILNFNTKIYNVFAGKNPDNIYPGDKILIPRSREGYRSKRNKLRWLKLEIRNHSHDQIGELEKNHAIHKSQRILLDFAGDVATTLALVATKAFKANQALKAASRAVGREIPAYQYLAKKEVEILSKHLNAKLRDEAFKGGLKYIDDRLGTAHNGYTTARDTIKAIRRVTYSSRSLLDMAEIVVANVKPSIVADWYLKLTIGTTPSATFSEMKILIENAMNAGSKNIDKQILALEREEGIVFGK